MISYPISLQEQANLLTFEQTLARTRQLLHRITSESTKKLILDFTNKVLVIMSNLRTLPHDKMQEIKQRQFSVVCREWIPQIGRINSEFVSLLGKISEVNLISAGSAEVDFSEITASLARKITEAKVQFTAIRLNLEKIMPQLTGMQQQEQIIAKQALAVNVKLAVALESLCQQVDTLVIGEQRQESFTQAITVSLGKLDREYAAVKKLYLELHKDIEAEKIAQKQPHQELPQLYAAKEKLKEEALQISQSLSARLEKLPNLIPNEREWILILRNNPKLTIQSIDQTQHKNIFNAIRSCIPLGQKLKEIDDIKLTIRRLISIIDTPHTHYRLSAELEERHKIIARTVETLNHRAAELLQAIEKELHQYDRLPGPRELPKTRHRVKSI